MKKVILCSVGIILISCGLYPAVQKYLKNLPIKTVQIEITQEEKVISQGLVTLYHNERIAYRDAAGVEHAIGAFYLENGAPVFHSSAAEPFATFATTPRSLKEIVDVMRSNMTMGDFEWIFLQTKGRDTVGKMVSFQTFWDEFQRLHPELFKNA